MNRRATPDASRLAAALQEDMGIEPQQDAEPLEMKSGAQSYWQLRIGTALYFVKSGEYAMLHAEADGLQQLAQANAVRVPQHHGVHEIDGSPYLVLEWLPLQGMNDSAATQLGQQLVQQHHHTARQYGYEQDNFIGLMPQLNTPCRNWAEFYATQRLQPQLDWLRERQAIDWQDDAQQLIDGMDELLAGHEPPASLLHGDLWAGNAAMTNGVPMIFDPAVHFGDRESDLAMTRLFGGFPESFRYTYEKSWPLPAGWQQREPLYQLYHVLNHANMFGGGYIAQAGRIVQQLLH